MKKYLVYIVCGVCLVSGLGCMAVSKMITPAPLDKEPVEYVVDKGVAEPTEYDGYQNLGMAEKLNDDLIDAVKIGNQELQNVIDKHQLKVERMTDSVSNSVKVGRELEETLFGKEGLLAMGLTLAGVGGFTGLLGLSRKRPQDFTTEDMELALGDIKGEVTQKEKNIIEIVKGIQKFIDKDSDNGNTLKDYLEAAQSSDTKELIARIKSSL